MINWILFAIIVILQVMDSVTTIKAIMGGAYESNKLMAWMMNRLGILPTLILAKAIVFGALLLAVLYWPSIYLTAAMVLIMGFYGWVVVNNVTVLKGDRF